MSRDRLTSVEKSEREALAEAQEFVDACSGLSDSREVRLIAPSANDMTSVSLGTIRKLVRFILKSEPRPDEIEAVKENLASLNEIIAEMTAKVSDDPNFTLLVVQQLRDHSWNLGYSFRGERPPS